MAILHECRICGRRFRHLARDEGPLEVLRAKYETGCIYKVDDEPWHIDVCPYCHGENHGDRNPFRDTYEVLYYKCLTCGQVSDKVGYWFWDGTENIDTADAA